MTSYDTNGVEPTTLYIGHNNGTLYLIDIPKHAIQMYTQWNEYNSNHQLYIRYFFSDKNKKKRKT